MEEGKTAYKEFTNRWPRKAKIEMNSKKWINKLENAHVKYEGVIGSIELELAPHIPFDFSIFWQSGDGFVIQNEMKNAPLDACLSHISKFGFLEYSDFKTLCI